MTRRTPWLAALALGVATSSVQAGWYEIKNYVGTIGNAPVHLSLQTYDDIGRQNDHRWIVDGNYYYDAYRTPIPLKGRRDKDGNLVLCEARYLSPHAQWPEVPPSSPASPVPCAIKLKADQDTASGEWNDGRKKLPITLSQVGSLDDTSNASPILTGTVEIPMWQHTKHFMLLGIYEASADCPVSMLHLRVIDISTGRVDHELPLDCDAGMINTSVYDNVRIHPNSPTKLIVGFQNGRMGRDEIIELSRLVKRK